jgi:hypothetical protein
MARERNTLPNFHSQDFATVVKLVPGGWEEIQSGLVGELLTELAAGRHGRPGARGLLIDGCDLPVFGRALTDLIASHEAS